MGEGGGLLCLFWKSKKVPWFWEKGPDCIHLCVKFSIQNVVLKVSKEKNSKIFPCGAFFSCVFDEMFFKVPKFHKTTSALKNFWLRACNTRKRCDICSKLTIDVTLLSLLLTWNICHIFCKYLYYLLWTCICLLGKI